LLRLPTVTRRNGAMPTTKVLAIKAREPERFASLPDDFRDT
jgi:hypothetical protein